ncbi:hypothetical protein AAUI01_04980 [Pseudomonas mosselii]|uniref:hypothetical protein n=1 Tax=Pseudomonas mosselii TaxID=78327 RepID=UPI0032E3D69B
MTKLIKLDPDNYRFLSDDDKCYHYGEYTSGGGFGKSETNQQIHNLKKKPTCSDRELHYKRLAVEYWGRILAGCISVTAESPVTFVPMPCSKPSGHADYDDRMLRVLQYMARSKPPLDIRPLIMQTTLRQSQHEGGGRQLPHQLLQTLAIDQTQLLHPPRGTIVVVDDVITMGASFNAAKTLLLTIPGVQHVIGIFLAKTVWQPSELDAFLTNSTISTNQ